MRREVNKERLRSSSHDATHFLMHFKSPAKRPLQIHSYISSAPHQLTDVAAQDSGVSMNQTANVVIRGGEKHLSEFCCGSAAAEQTRKEEVYELPMDRPPRHVDATAIRSAARHLLAAAFLLLCALPPFHLAQAGCTVKTAFIAFLRPRPASCEFCKFSRNKLEGCSLVLCSGVTSTFRAP